MLVSGFSGMPVAFLDVETEVVTYGTSRLGIFLLPFFRWVYDGTSFFARPQIPEAEISLE